MKKSGLSESIASEVPYLVSLDEIFEQDKENALLVLCNIINALPEIIPISAINEYGLAEFIEKLINEPLTSSSAVLFAIAKDKFNEFSLKYE